MFFTRPLFQFPSVESGNETLQINPWSDLPVFLSRLNPRKYDAHQEFYDVAIVLQDIQNYIDVQRCRSSTNPGIVVCDQELRKILHTPLCHTSELYYFLTLNFSSVLDMDNHPIFDIPSAELDLPVHILTSPFNPNGLFRVNSLYRYILNHWCP